MNELLNTAVMRRLRYGAAGGGSYRGPLKVHEYEISEAFFQGVITQSQFQSNNPKHVAKLIAFENPSLLLVSLVQSFFGLIPRYEKAQVFSMGDTDGLNPYQTFSAICDEIVNHYGVWDDVFKERGIAPHVGYVIAHISELEMENQGKVPLQKVILELIKAGYDIQGIQRIMGGTEQEVHNLLIETNLAQSYEAKFGSTLDGKVDSAPIKWGSIIHRLTKEKESPFRIITKFGCTWEDLDEKMQDTEIKKTVTVVTEKRIIDVYRRIVAQIVVDNLYRARDLKNWTEPENDAWRIRTETNLFTKKADGKKRIFNPWSYFPELVNLLEDYHTEIQKPQTERLTNEEIANKYGRTGMLLSKILRHLALPNTYLTYTKGSVAPRWELELSEIAVLIESPLSIPDREKLMGWKDHFVTNARRRTSEGDRIGEIFRSEGVLRMTWYSAFKFYQTADYLASLGETHQYSEAARKLGLHNKDIVKYLTKPATRKRLDKAILHFLKSIEFYEALTAGFSVTDSKEYAGIENESIARELIDKFPWERLKWFTPPENWE